MPILSVNCRAQTQTSSEANSQSNSETQTQAPAVRPNLYACEGCEGVFEREPETLSAKTTIPPAGEPGEPLILRGTVYHPDGRTPAEGVVLYVYHTDSEGLYSRGSDESEWSRRHGLLRGWVRTGPDGRYEIRTIKPGAYPNSRAPAHIHPTVLEPGKPPYWIDDVVFAGEQGVTESYRAQMRNRGGSGIVRLGREGETWLAVRDIVLERHPD